MSATQPERSSDSFIGDRTPDLVRTFSKEVREDPAVLFAQLRNECPVALQQGGGRRGAFQDAWLITRYEDILKVAADTDTFGQSVRWPEQRRPPLESNPPEHRAFRALMQPFFMPGALAAFEPTSRRIALELLDPLLAAGTGDFAHNLARPLPPQVLLARMNQPLEDWAAVKPACEASFLQGATDPADAAAYDAANEFLWDYSRKAVEARKTNPPEPGTDIIGALLSGQIDGQPVDEGLIVGMVRLVLAAGHDSTTSAMGICLGFLARNQPAQDQLRANPKMIPAAVEEILRLEAPVLQMPRTVMRDTELRGRELKKGDRLLLVFASGNHDPEAFEDVESCVLDRLPNRHLSFGVGVHVCIGNGLARQEIRVTLEELLARTRSFGMDGEPSREFWHPYGATSLPIRTIPA